MKIVHVITRLLRAGAEENTLATCKYQLDNGHDVYVLHGEEFDQSLIDEQPPGLKIVAVPEMIHPVSPVDDFKAVLALKKHYQAINPDVIHTHHSKAGVLGRLAASMKNSTVVHTVHIAPFVNVSVVPRTIYIVAEKIAARKCDAIISVSSGMREAYRTHSIGTSAQHFVVHSGMQLEKFVQSEDVSANRNELLAKTNSKFIVLMLAAFEPRKRQENFLQKAAPMLKRNPHIGIVFCGEGARRTAAEELATELGLGSQIQFLGFQPNPESFIKSADLCILTSEREGLPRVLVQYTAAGKPTVVTKLLGIEEIVKDGVSGIVMDENDLAGVATKIEQLSQEPERLARLAEGAKAIDVSSWSLEKMGEEIQVVYSKFPK